MKLCFLILLVTYLPLESLAFGVVSRNCRNDVGLAFGGGICSHQHITTSRLFAEQDDDSKDDTPAEPQSDSMTKEEKEEAVGNLVADDEWNGLTLELSELVRLSIVEDLKKNTREFIGKDDYKVGDISKELDSRVKQEVANLRGKEEYELGDLTIALDTLSKDLTCELTGNENYKPGDLSKELDKRIKESVASFCGKDTYEVGDLSREVSKRVSARVADFTGKDNYELGDISRQIEERRRAWVADYLDKDPSEYEFGDITKKFLGDYTGKGEDYQFGDATKKFVGDLFGGKKNKGGGK